MEPVNTTFQHVPKFSPGKGKMPDLQKLFGSLKNVTCPYNPEPKVIGEHTTNLNTCYNLNVSLDGSMWKNDQTMLKKVVPTDNGLKILMNFNCIILNMSQMKNGDLLLTVVGSPILKVLPSGTTELKDSCYDVSPLQPFGVHATPDNKVIISVFDKESIQEVVQRKVIVMNQLGFREKVFLNDHHNKPLFTLPRRVTSNNVNIISVVDLLSDNCYARTVFLDLSGNIKNIYGGHHSVNSYENQFRPRDILSLPLNNFLVTERLNVLHILNSEGESLTFYNTLSLGIHLPYSMCFSGQYLFISSNPSSNQNENCKDKAKIYKLENFEWY
ncbi:unnamed protein product [Mytilus coruscus]|uniref:Uncharacterized protein n=1 Tax=Mytilus coruscus TaxID=42192 RepID=A0A6J8BSE8_MYTCO|nr:unnamed protein product [Mytilus coruscus]